MSEFMEFAKIPRLSRECIVTEKIDGTNGVVYVGDDGEFLVGSRSRWITPEADNFGFAKWAYEHRDELVTLGPGWHHGEWWGQGIQRKYGLDHKRWSLFNTSRWSPPGTQPQCPKCGYTRADCGLQMDHHLCGQPTPPGPPPPCCHVVPVLWRGVFDTDTVAMYLNELRHTGSIAAPGFMKPEGVVIWHEAARCFFKKTLENDEQPKGQAST